MAAASPVASAPRVRDTLNQAWKNDKNKFGLKMLQKMGWTEGKGLGKNEDGVSEHVKVAKKSNNLGLGATHDSTGAAGWASTAVSFNNVLETLGKAYGTAGQTKNERDSSSASTSSSKKKKSKKSKKGRKSRKTGGNSDDSSSGEGGVGARGGAQAVSSCPSRARRVRSKDVKSFSTADLRAILGQAATTSLPCYPVVGESTSTSTSGRDGVAEEAKKKNNSSSSSSSSKKKKRSREERDGNRTESRAGGGTAAVGLPSTTTTLPHRPRTRSMDLDEPSETLASEAVASTAAAAGNRPRTRSMDRTEEGDAASSVAATAGKSQPRKAIKNKAGRARREAEPRKRGEGEGEEEEDAPAVGSEKKRRKKTNRRRTTGEEK